MPTLTAQQKREIEEAKKEIARLDAQYKEAHQESLGAKQRRDMAVQRENAAEQQVQASQDAAMNAGIRAKHNLAWEVEETRRQMSRLAKVKADPRHPRTKIVLRKLKKRADTLKVDIHPDGLELHELAEIQQAWHDWFKDYSKWEQSWYGDYAVEDEVEVRVDGNWVTGAEVSKFINHPRDPMYRFYNEVEVEVVWSDTGRAGSIMDKSKILPVSSPDLRKPADYYSLEAATRKLPDVITEGGWVDEVRTRLDTLWTNAADMVSAAKENMPKVPTLNEAAGMATDAASSMAGAVAGSRLAMGAMGPVGAAAGLGGSLVGAAVGRKAGEMVKKGMQGGRKLRTKRRKTKRKKTKRTKKRKMGGGSKKKKITKRRNYKRTKKIRRRK